MRTNLKLLISSSDLSGLLFSLSGIVLGILLAAADYFIHWDAAAALVLTVVPMHIYMTASRKWALGISAVGAVLTVYLSYGVLFCLESLLLLLFGYFILRLARGFGGKSRIADCALVCFLKGPVALFGAYFICTHSFPFWFLLFPALSVGVLSAASEAAKDHSAKNLIAVLVVLGLVLTGVYTFLRVMTLPHFLYLITVPVFAFVLIRMYKKKEQDPDSFSLALALCTFALALLTGVGFIGYLF